MPLILIELPGGESPLGDLDNEVRHIENSGRDKTSVTLDPVVYVVPGELSDEPAVFAREEDAESFANTYDPPRGVFKLLICDAEMSAQMVADRSGQTDADEQPYQDGDMVKPTEGAFRLFVIGSQALSDGGNWRLYESDDCTGPFWMEWDVELVKRGQRYAIEPSEGGAFFIRDLTTGELVKDGIMPLMPSTQEHAEDEVRYLTRLHKEA